MYLLILIHACYLTITLIAILAFIIPTLRASILSYGKLNQTVTPAPNHFASWFKQWTVPKAWFSHFYYVGAAFGVWCFAEVAALVWCARRGPLIWLFRLYDVKNGTFQQDPEESVLALLLLNLHLIRRCWEVIFIEKASKDAKMHIGHYLVGMGFYGAVVLGSWCEGAGSIGVWFPENSLPVSDGITPLAWLGPLMILGTFLFTIGWITQNRLHRILASLRSDPALSGEYFIPRGSWFENIVCPHYLCEVFIYLGLCLLTRFRNKTLIYATVWTVVNLGIVSWETNQWYKVKFGDELKKAFPSGRWLMIPPIY